MTSHYFDLWIIHFYFNHSLLFIFLDSNKKESLTESDDASEAEDLNNKTLELNQNFDELHKTLENDFQNFLEKYKLNDDNIDIKKTIGNRINEFKMLISDAISVGNCSVSKGRFDAFVSFWIILLDKVFM